MKNKGGTSNVPNGKPKLGLRLWRITQKRGGTMLRIRDLSDEELNKLLSKPLSQEEAEALSKANQEDRWLLALNLQEMEKEGYLFATRPGFFARLKKAIKVFLLKLKN